MRIENRRRGAAQNVFIAVLAGLGLVGAPSIARAQSAEPAAAAASPVVLNGCSLDTQVMNPGGAAPSMQNTFTVKYTVQSTKPIAEVEVHGVAGRASGVWTDKNKFPASGSVTHAFTFQRVIGASNVSCDIKSVKFGDGSTWTPPAA
jgi:hypothetical protein